MRSAVMGAVATVVALLVGAPATAQDGPPGDLAVSVFTRIGAPGQPDTVYATDDRVYVTSHNAMAGDQDAPSVLWAYDHDGNLEREYVIEGQDTDEVHGLLEIAVDADGTVYLADRAPPRVITIDPDSGAQDTYVDLRDVPTCSGEPDGDCSDARMDMAPFTDGLVFAPDGTMYVTDLQQSLVWRVPPGGGEAEVWLTDPRFESIFGVNGNQFRPDGRTLVLSVTAAVAPGTGGPTRGFLYETVIQPDGTPGALTEFWASEPGDGPDGFAIARSGRIYVALPGANAMAVVGTGGEEVARVPADPVTNQLRDIPFDMPSSVTFLGTDVLVANQSIFRGQSDHWAVFRIAAGEPGIPLFEPDVPTTATPSTDGSTEEPAAAPQPAESATATPAAAATSDAAPTAAGQGGPSGGLPATGGGTAVVAVVVLLAGVLRRGAGGRTDA